MRSSRTPPLPTRPGWLFHLSTKTASAALVVMLATTGVVSQASGASATYSDSAYSSPTFVATVPAQPSGTPAPGTAVELRSLRRGMSGPDVSALQQHLLELGYWMPSVDGSFGLSTQHAVVALQKAAKLLPDGIVGKATRQALASGVRPGARSTAGHVIEVDLTRQLLLVVDNGTVTEIHDTSTGQIAGTTPTGSFIVVRQIDGYRHSALGTLYRPKYFVGGVAIHGFASVPPYPASHGCVRVTNRSIDHLWSAGLAPIGTPVRVYR